jgi:hypothetical protein
MELSIQPGDWSPKKSPCKTAEKRRVPVRKVARFHLISFWGLLDIPTNMGVFSNSHGHTYVKNVNI